MDKLRVSHFLVPLFFIDLIYSAPLDKPSVNASAEAAPMHITYTPTQSDDQAAIERLRIFKAAKCAIAGQDFPEFGVIGINGDPAGPIQIENAGAPRRGWRDYEIRLDGQKWGHVEYPERSAPYDKQAYLQRLCS